MGAAVGSGVVVALVCYAFYRNRWRIWLRLFNIRRNFRRTRMAPRNGHGIYKAVQRVDWKYDAYISYIEEDYHWVIDHILRGIDNGKDNKGQECGGRFDLYMKYRCDNAGKLSLSSMYEKMDVSRHVIIVLSQYYIEDRFHEMELEVILDKYAGREIDSFVVVTVGKLEAKHVPKCLHPTMKREEFLEWEDDPNAKEVFSTRLQERLEKKAHYED